MKYPIVYFIEAICGILLREVFNVGLLWKNEVFIYIFVVYLFIWLCYWGPWWLISSVGEPVYGVLEVKAEGQ